MLNLLKRKPLPEKQTITKLVFRSPNAATQTVMLMKFWQGENVLAP